MKIRIAIALTLVLIFQCFCLIYWIPTSSFKEDSPILNDDYPFHYSQIVSAINFFKEDGKRWGYNPFLLAGYPAPIFFGEDQMAWELFVYLLSYFLPLGVSFKLYVALFFIVFPFLCYLSGRNFGMKEQESFIALILGILIFYLPMVYKTIGGATMVTWGMVSFIFACYLSSYVLSVFYNFLEHSGKRQIVLLFVFAPLLWLTHALAPLILMIPMSLILFSYLRELERKKYILLAILFIWTVFINSYWIIPIFKFLEYKRGTATARLWASKNLYLPYEFYIKSLFSKDIFYFSILIFGLIGIFLLYRNGKSKIAIPLFGQTVFLFCLSFYGGFFSFVEDFHPLRFIFPLHLFLIFPCAAVINKVLTKPYFRILFVLIFVVYLSKPVKKYLIGNLFFGQHYLLNTETPKRVDALVEWVIKNTTSEGRILLEDVKSPMHHHPPYFKSHFGSLLPIYTQREFVAAPMPVPKKAPWMLHTFSTFREGELFWRDLDSFSIEELKSYFDLYNINWVICWMKMSRNYFDQHNDYIKFVKQIGGFYIYKVFRSPSFFFKGEGDIVSTYNRMSLNNIKPQDNEIVIKYHWMKYLKTDPDLEIKKVMLLDDPVGFIMVKDPPESLTIYNDY